ALQAMPIFTAEFVSAGVPFNASSTKKSRAPDASTSAAGIREAAVQARSGRRLTRLVVHGRDVARRATKYLGAFPLGLRRSVGIVPSCPRLDLLMRGATSDRHPRQGHCRTDYSAQFTFPQIA